MKPAKFMAFGVILLMVLAGPLSGPASGTINSYTVKKISPALGGDGGFAFNQKGHLAWRGLGGNVHLYRNGVKETIFSEAAIPANSLMMNDSDQVVWSSASTAGTGDIYLYSGGSVSKLTDYAATGTGNTYPQINNAGDIAWVQTNASGQRVVLWQGGGLTFESSYVLAIAGPPSLNNQGRVIWAQKKPETGEKFQVWSNFMGQVTGDCWTDDPRPLLRNESLGGVYYLIWCGAINSLFRYETGYASTITFDLNELHTYAMNDRGYVAWMHTGPAVGRNLYVNFDGGNQQMANDTVFNNINPAINNNDLVAYAVENVGVAVTNFRTGDTTFLAAADPRIIKINDHDQVAWGSATELYLAAPITFNPGGIFLLLLSD